MNENLLTKFLKFSYGSWVGIFIGLLTTVIATRILPVEAFGKASMFDLAIQVGLIFIIFGTDQSFVRFFYEEKEYNRGKLLINCLKIPVASLFIFITFITIFKEEISRFIFGEYNINLFIILVFGLALQLLYRYAQLVIRMDQQATFYSILQILHKLLNLMLIIVLFYILGGIFQVMILAKIITLMILCIVGIFFGRKFWSFDNLKHHNLKHSQKDIIKYGAPFVLTIFITWLFESFDKIALRQWSDFSELGLYAAAMKIIALLMILKQTFSTFWSPVSYEKFENDSRDTEFFKSINTLVSFAMFFVAISTIMVKDILVLLLGEDFMEAASIMPFLVFMPLLYTISETTVVGINFYKKVKWHIFISLVACIVNIIGNWILVPNYGALGASISTAISFIIFFSLRSYISSIYFKVSYSLKKIYFMIFILFSFAILALFIESVIILILIGVIPLIILFALYFNEILYIFKNRNIIFK